jgi:hypothetical protein
MIKFEHHRTTVFSFGHYGEEQIPTSNISKQLEDVLQEEWYKIPLELVQNLYESIQRGTAAVLKQKDGPTS